MKKQARGAKRTKASKPVVKDLAPGSRKGAGVKAGARGHDKWIEINSVGYIKP